MHNPAQTPHAESLLAFWQNLSIPVSSPATNTAIIRFEQHYSVTLPADFGTYLRMANGMAHTDTWTCDDETITFWHLPETDDQIAMDYNFICPASRAWPQCRQPEAERLYVFADYCICIFDFAIDLNPSSSDYGAVFRLMDTVPQRISSSFDEFIMTYIASRDKIIFGDPGETDRGRSGA